MSNSTPIYDIAELLDSFYISQFVVIVYQFAIPIMGFIGTILCPLNVVIFFKKIFQKTEFDYFKVLSVAYLINVMSGIIYGFSFSPEFFPSIDSHWCVIYQTAYVPISLSMLHFTGVVEIGILLDRIKIFSPFIKKHFTLSPRRYCLLSFFVCILIDIFFAFYFVPSEGFTYYFTDKNGFLKANSYYFISLTDFALSQAGKVLYIFTFILRDCITMCVSVFLNLVSMIQLNNYYRLKKTKSRRNQSLTASTSTSTTRITVSETNNMIIVITLCLINIITRSFTMLTNIYFLFTSDYVGWTCGAIADLFVVSGPAVSFLVFYRFNKIFRNEVGKVLWHMSKSNGSQSSSKNTPLTDSSAKNTQKNVFVVEIP